MGTVQGCAPAAPARNLGRGGPSRSGAQDSGARKCIQTINFPPAPPRAVLGGGGGQGPPASSHAGSGLRAAGSGLRPQ